MDATNHAADYSDYFIKQIIHEVGGAYLARDKDQNDAIDLIQSRASLWVAEQYG